MEKELEFIYKEEYVRQKARYDFEKNQLAEKIPAKSYNKALYYSSIYIILGSISMYILYSIYISFT